MTTVIAEFDGKVFVPEQTVDLPAGTKVSISLPAPPPKQTPADVERWKELMQALNAEEPYFPTVEDAIGYTRKYPGYYP